MRVRAYRKWMNGCAAWSARTLLLAVAALCGISAPVGHSVVPPNTSLSVLLASPIATPLASTPMLPTATPTSALAAVEADLDNIVADAVALSPVAAIECAQGTAAIGSTDTVGIWYLACGPSRVPVALLGHVTGRTWIIVAAGKRSMVYIPGS